MSIRWHLTTHPAEVSITLRDPTGAEVPLETTDDVERLAALVEAGTALELTSDMLARLVALGRLPWTIAEVEPQVEVIDNRPDETFPTADDEVAEPVTPAELEPPRVALHLAKPATPATTRDLSAFRAATFEALRSASYYGKDDRRTVQAREAALSLPDIGSDDRETLERAIANGHREFVALTRLDDVLFRGGLDSAAAQQVVDELRRQFRTNNYILRKIDRALDRARTRRSRASQWAEGSIVHATDTAHQIPRLAPAVSWTLLIDEGGQFDEPVPGEPTASGKVVGLLIPNTVSLPDLAPGWHAVEQTSVAEIDRVVQVVLDAQVGIIGLRTEALLGTLGDAWLSAVLELVAWVVRLMPVDGSTQLEVLVEQRGEHVGGTRWRAGAVAVRRMLAAASPARATAIDMTLRLIGKADSPLNGYVDALAFTWTSPATTSKARLKQSKLLDACLLRHTKVQASIIRDALVAADALPANVWADLAGLSEADDPGSLVSFLLSRTAAACRDQPALWQTYLTHTKEHLESKAISLATLGRQVAFLSSCAPDSAHFDPALRLAWSVAQLEAANHTGALAVEVAADVEALARRLFDEDPVMVCQADLDIAVMHTNAFRFDDATTALGRWAEQPMAVPGRRHWGRLQSTMGQHDAFRGHAETAIRHFQVALEAFAGLYDAGSAAREIRQTQTYLAIAAMDATAGIGIDARVEVEKVVSLSPPEIGRLAASSGNDEKYAHHLLVRWLWSHGTAEQCLTYLNSASDARWPAGDGHPWPLIEAYRGAMLVVVGGREAAVARFEHSVDLAFEGGPTLEFIARVLGLFRAKVLGEPLPPVLAKAGPLRAALPDAPWSVLEGAARLTPREFLSAALPFNFR